MRILLCGTNYGATYLRALHANESGLRLAAVLARSERSRALAAHAGAPFYTRIEDVPRDAIDAACVAISGDIGRAVTTALLERGVHVLAEHPQWRADVAAHRETARRNRAVYHVNGHYSDIDAAATFVATFRATAQRSRLLFVNVLTNLRALYSAIEIVGRAAGPLHGMTITRVPPAPPEFFTIFRSGLLTVHVQNATSAVDDGSSMWVSHNITAGFEDGVLTLTEAYGPVSWVPVPPSLPQLQSSAGGELWKRPLLRTLATPPPTFSDYVTWARDRANRIALERFAAEIRTGRTSPEQSDAHLLTVSEVWERMLGRDDVDYCASARS